MRLVSYNILDGGEGRADPLAEAVEAQRADVVALVEADFMPTLERIAGRLGMDYVHAAGNEHAVALLSRWPIIQSVNHAAMRPGLSKCLLEAKLREHGGREWTVGVVHLHARATEADETRREREIDIVLDTFATHRANGVPHLLVGDFNANHPRQVIDPERCKPSTREAWHANGGKIPRRAIQRLLDAGYIDTLEAHAGDRAFETGTFTTQHPGQRVDYVFAHGIDPGRITWAWVEQDRLAKYASDHFPVGVDVV
ncbi:MAG: endonuclease/exonuclease/phosphatase family protein [Tepidisphaeraceae bacterium]